MAHSYELQKSMSKSVHNHSIAIVGAGAMGSGIAQVAAQAGHSVVLFDTNLQALERSQIQLAKIADRQVIKGRWTPQESEALQGRIARTSKLQDVVGCALVLEAIVEDFDTKISLFQKIESIVPASTILATNTSSLSVTALAGQLTHPERLLGLHFFNPAPLMALVEIVPALQTDNAIVEQCQTLMAAWKKSAVIAKDTPGFIVNRLARPFYGEALRIAEEGQYSLETIDAALRAVGFRMGPFQLMDLIGNDVNYAVTCTVFDAFYFDPRYRPSLIQKQHVDAGWLGKKTRRGYYSYQEDGQVLADDAPKVDSKAQEQISNRILSLLINEAADALRLNIASAEDLEIAMTKGVNYPKGLLKWGNDWGIANVLEKLETLQQEYGEERYRPSPLLKQMASRGMKFDV